MDGPRLSPGVQSPAIPISKGWKADSLGEYDCPKCGKRTPHEIKVRFWWTAVFGNLDSALPSGCLVLSFVIVLGVLSGGVLGVLILFLLGSVVKIFSQALGESLFPTPRRCVVCHTPSTLADARRTASSPDAPIMATLAPEPLARPEWDEPRIQEAGQEVPTLRAATGKLVIHRRWAMTAALFAFQVHVDGQHAANLENGGTLAFELPVGQRSIQVKVGVMSRTTTVSIEHGQTRRYQVFISAWGSLGGGVIIKPA